MSTQGEVSLNIVEQYVRAFLQGDDKTQLDLLSDEIIIDYAHGHGFGKKRLLKQDALNFHKDLRAQVELIDYKVFKAFGDGNTVFILGNKTEKVKKTGIIHKEDCIWVYTLEEGLIVKIECLKECHALFDFFSTIIDRNHKSENDNLLFEMEKSTIHTI